MSTTKVKQVGNSAGVTLSKEVLTTAGLKLGDEVVVEVVNDTVVISRSDSGYARAMEAGRQFAGHYSRTMAALAK